MTMMDHVLDATLRVMARKKLSVFLFHGVPKEAALLSDQLTLDDFEQTIHFVSKRFAVLPLDEAAKRLASDELPSNAACITFDDGYSSWFDGAVDLLEKNNLHATFFITTGQFAGTPMWHERVAHAVMQMPGPNLNLPGFGLPLLPLNTLVDRRAAFALIENLLKYLNPAVQSQSVIELERAAGVQMQSSTAMKLGELRDLANRGFGLGAHTVTHPILQLCDPKTALREIGEAREFLQSETGVPITGFAYPNGRPHTDFGRHHVEMVKATGYTHAVTTQWGAASSVKTPVFEIPRFTPWGPSHKHMAFQMIRNLAALPKITSVRTDVCDSKPPTVMYVENGSGFGGAVVALRTLLSCRQPNNTCHVVCNLAVGDFTRYKSVKTQTLIPDRAVDLAELVSAVKALGWGRFGRAILFGIGRIDDLVNRLPYILRLWRLARRVRPDVIHGNNEPGANREAMLVAKLMRLPYVQHLRGPLGGVRHARWLLAQPDAFIPVSRWLAGELLLAGVNAGRIRHIYDGVEFQHQQTVSDRPTLRQQIGLPENCTVVAMVGMMVTWKGQDDFIGAVSTMHQAYPDTYYLIVGDTPERAGTAFSGALQDQVNRLGLGQRIHFTGRRADLVQVLPQVDIVVSASKMPEPLGLVMLEAMAAECVFIGPAHGAVPEVVVDGENGYTFVPNSSLSLAKTLEKALQNLSSDKPLRRQARAAVEANFSGQRCVAETAMVYRSCMPC